MIINISTAENSLIKNFVDIGKRNSLNLTNNVNYVKYEDSSKTVPVNGIFSNIYRDHLISVSEEVELTEKEYNKYKFKPKLLSYDLYGTVEYWYILMIINNISTITNFNLKKIRYIPSEKLDLLELIINKEQTHMVSKQDNPLILKEI